jgi:hypothetical protein
MSESYALTPNNGLNKKDGCSVNAYHCNIFLSNGFKDNTGCIYMGYTKFFSPPPQPGLQLQPPTDYNFVINTPITPNDIYFDFFVGVPSINSVFTLLDNTGKFYDSKSCDFDNDATKIQPVSLHAKGSPGVLILQVTAANPGADIFYFYKCNIKIV